MDNKNKILASLLNIKTQLEAKQELLACPTIIADINPKDSIPMKKVNKLSEHTTKHINIERILRNICVLKYFVFSSFILANCMQNKINMIATHINISVLPNINEML
ncbi:MAG: hypothetical protein LBP31_00770 [Holosporales bacterium]|jgi:hypothetical protein|nr:hypothetical protein [Holosporales bacterium]